MGEKPDVCQAGQRERGREKSMLGTGVAVQGGRLGL